MTKPTNIPPEDEIQKILKVLKETRPEEATRENAIKTIESMKALANILVDRVDDDLKSGKVKVNDKGEVFRAGKLISKPAKKLK
jgi:hypothetical protein